jgi:hypothetical protein
MTTNDEGKEIPNLEYLTWNKKDQYLLCLITASLFEKVLTIVYGLNTSHQAWTALSIKFALKSKSRISNLKKKLQGLSQGSKSCLDFMQAAKHIADQLVAAGNPISDEELISFILNGLNPNFTDFITTYSFHTRANEISYEDFQYELISHEMLLNQHQNHTPDQSTFALNANKPFQQSRGRPPMQNRFSPRPYSPRQGFGYSAPRPYHQQFNRGINQYPRGSSSQYQGNAFSNRQFPPGPLPSSQGGNFSQNARTPCQICGRINHLAIDCYHRMDCAFQGRNSPIQLAAMATQSNLGYEEQNWLADSGANPHITNQLGNLQIQQPFQQR